MYYIAEMHIPLNGFMFISVPYFVVYSGLSLLATRLAILAFILPDRIMDNGIVVFEKCMYISLYTKLIHYICIVGKV